MENFSETFSKLLRGLEMDSYEKRIFNVDSYLKRKFDWCRKGDLIVGDAIDWLEKRW